jgi:hypothetical protein
LSGSDEPTPAPFEAEYFCANPSCVLHRRQGDVGVRGHGNWAILDDGRVASRSRYGAVILCDACGRAALASLPR